MTFIGRRVIKIVTVILSQLHDFVPIRKVKFFSSFAEFGRSIMKNC